MLQRHDGGRLSAITTLVRGGWVPVLIALATTSCGSEPTTPGGGLGPPPVIAQVAGLVLVTAPSDTMRAFDALIPQPWIELRDSLNHRVPKGGVPVTVSLSDGVALGRTTVLTDASGDARFPNVQVGGPTGRRLLNFSSPGLDTLAHPIFLRPGSAIYMRAVDTTTQVATVGSSVPILPAVVVTDMAHNPVPGQTVGFFAEEGGGTVEGAVQVTDAHGMAQVTSWTLGPLPGQNVLMANSTAFQVVNFVAVGVAAGP